MMEVEHMDMNPLPYEVRKKYVELSVAEIEAAGARVRELRLKTQTPKQRQELGEAARDLRRITRFYECV